jgi:hypothetical protein
MHALVAITGRTHRAGQPPLPYHIVFDEEGETCDGKAALCGQQGGGYGTQRRWSTTMPMFSELLPTQNICRRCLALWEKRGRPI